MPILQSPEEMLIAAATAAILYHGDQKDYAGVPFYHHVLRVGIAMSPDPEAMVIGFLHDLVEDTDQNIHDIWNVFGPEIAANVNYLTHPKGESYWQYIDRLIDASRYFPKALLVKRQDLLDNLDPWRQIFPNSESLARRHKRALRLVEEALVSRGLLNESKRYDGIRGTETGRFSGESSSWSDKLGRPTTVGEPQSPNPTTTSTVAPVPGPGALHRDYTVAGNLYPRAESEIIEPPDFPF